MSKKYNAVANASQSASQTFVKGAAILTVSMVVVKVFGVLDKVILTNIYSMFGQSLASMGMGIYNNAYEVFGVIFTVATGGLPIVISRMISQNMAEERYKDVKQVHRVSIPLFLVVGLVCTIGLMLVSFSLLGIGNALMQTSLNPLVATVVRGGHLASTLTFGQFVKAIASFMAPYIAAWGATQAIPSFGLGWRVLFPIYMIIGIAASLFLLSTPIEEEGPAFDRETSPTVGKQFAACFRLLGKPIVLLSFIGIMCHVGIDVGTNTTAPKILIERLGMTLNDAAFATSLYFIFRTIGCLTGSFFLRVVNNRLFFVISITMMALSMCGLFFGTTKLVLYIAIALVGYGNSNVFSLVFAQALQSVPDKQNEVSGLMIMGLFGGTIFPLIMGFASDAMGQAGAVLVMAVGVAYLFTYIKNVK